jgi:hypothetical protein
MFCSANKLLNHLNLNYFIDCYEFVGDDRLLQAFSISLLREEQSYVIKNKETKVNQFIKKLLVNSNSRRDAFEAIVNSHPDKKYYFESFIHKNYFYRCAKQFCIDYAKGGDIEFELYNRESEDIHSTFIQLIKLALRKLWKYAKVKNDYLESVNPSNENDDCIEERKSGDDSGWKDVTKDAVEREKFECINQNLHEFFDKLDAKELVDKLENSYLRK